MKVYICYEENYHELEYELGPVTGVTVFSNPMAAAEWMRKEVEQGKADGYVIDQEAKMDLVDENNEVNRMVAIYEITRCKYVQIVMFNGYQENWEESYAICVDEKELLDKAD